MSDFVNVISLGAGKQSSYMLLNALEGKYKYKPDYAIFSDTGCEPKYVYDYLVWLRTYVGDRYNFFIEIVNKGDLLSDVLDYVNGSKDRASQLPYYLKDGGLMMRQCTLDYKITPLRRHLQSIRKKHKVRLWIGISLDEAERMKDSPVKYIEHYYPLVETQTRIDQIINWFKTNNLREPGKSACLICPFHHDNYWKIFKQQFPEEFKYACDFDDKIRHYPKLRSDVFLSKHRIPLRDVDFSMEASLFPDLIEECNGLCGL